MSGHTDANDQAHSLFGRIIVGIDGSAESLEAARQAAILADGELTLLTAYNVAPAVGGTGVGVPYYQDEDVLRKAATEVVARAREHVAATPAVGRVVFGRPADALVAAIESERYTLLVVGSHGLGRVTGFVVGSTANEVIRRLPCSVLLARGQSANGWPGRIVAGIDGSAGSAAAYEVARHLSRRFGADLLPVVAGGGKGVDREQIGLIVASGCEELNEHPVKALVAASADADLLVVGSRGLHGLKALGSVSERVAHQARSSVLIVHLPGQ